jgi:hypothetical protein
MSAIRKRTFSLGTVTTGTPSNRFPLGEWDDVLIYVTNPSVSMTVTLQSTPDDGTTWVGESTSSASASAYTFKVNAPLGPDLGRVTLSAGNSPVFVTVTKRGVNRG